MITHALMMDVLRRVPRLVDAGSLGHWSLEPGTWNSGTATIPVMLPTIAREDGAVVMIDQRKLPAEENYVAWRTAAEVARAIKTMVIRGAPAIGVAAAMGIALGMR